MIIAIVIGFVTGWLMSMPIGPVNAAVISRTLKYTFKVGIAVASGAALMDIIYCGGAAQINQFLIESPLIDLAFQSLGCAALIFLGVRMFRQRRALAQTKTAAEVLEEVAAQDEELANRAVNVMHLRKKNLVGPFIMGVLLYATNVAAVPEWIIVAGIWRGWGILGTGVDINIAFAIGAGLGTMGWYIVLARWIAKRQRGFAASTHRKINLGTGIAMLLFGAYFGYRIIFQTNWTAVRSHFESTTGMVHTS